MNRLAHVLVPMSAVELGNNDRRAGGQAHKEAHQQIDQVARRAAYRRERFLAHKPTHDHRVGRVVQLLEKGS